MARNTIKFGDTLVPNTPSLIEFESMPQPEVAVFWRASRPSGEIAENGFMSIEDAERLAYWLFAVVDSLRRNQFVG